MKMIEDKEVVCECGLRERQKVRKRTILTEVFHDYCSSTSLHGIGYLGADDKSYAEKVWWIIVFILSLLVCSYLITRTWIKWTNDPVILSFEKEQIPLWEIPFPAVTICPVNKVERNTYNYTEMFRNRNNLTEEESKEFWDISLVCNLEQYLYADFNCTFNTTDEDAIMHILTRFRLGARLCSQIALRVATVFDWDFQSTESARFVFDWYRLPARRVLRDQEILLDVWRSSNIFRAYMAMTENNMSKVKKSIILDILIEYSSSTEDEEFLKYLKDNRKKPKVKNFIDNVIDNYTEVQKAPRVGTSIGEIKWQNKRLEFVVFANQITEEGSCFTFNSFGQDEMYTDAVNNTIPFISYPYDRYKVAADWSLEQGYKHKIKETDYPRRTTKDGIASGLSFMLRSLAEDTDYVCGMPISGYKIILHNPSEVPKAAQQYYLVPEGRKANIVIKPELTKTSKSLRGLRAETRKCYFSDEKSLKFFKVYTQSNCRIECNTNITLKYCDCVPFYLPREANTTICGYASKNCMKEVERTILELEMLDNRTNMTEEDKERIEFTMEIYNKCNCLPSCNSLEYSAETSQSEYHLVKTMLASGLHEDDFSADEIEKLSQGFVIITQLDIFFKESQFYALKRSEIYGKVDFLANVGGLLGLFMGFSLLSLIEIVYFLTIRIWFKCKGKKVR